MNYTVDDLRSRANSRKRSFGSKSVEARALILDESKTLSLHRRYARANDGLHTVEAAAALRAYQVRSTAAEARRDASPASVRVEADV